MILVWLIGFLIISPIVAYFGVKHDWFVTKMYDSYYPNIMLLPITFGVMFWPFTIFLLPVGLAIYFGIRAKNK